MPVPPGQPQGCTVLQKALEKALPATVVLTGECFTSPGALGNESLQAFLSAARGAEKFRRGFLVVSRKGQESNSPHSILQPQMSAAPRLTNAGLDSLLLRTGISWLCCMHSRHLLRGLVHKDPQPE